MSKNSGLIASAAHGAAWRLCPCTRSPCLNPCVYFIDAVHELMTTLLGARSQQAKGFQQPPKWELAWDPFQPSLRRVARSRWLAFGLPLDSVTKRILAHACIVSDWTGCLCCREAADGNDPSSGLKRPILFVADLRRHTAGALRTPERHWGNLVTTQVVQPPAASEPPPSDMTGCLHETLAAAACAVRSGVRSFYSDPEGLQKAWTGVLQMEDVVYWRNARTTPGFSPSRDSACCMSSWRGTSGESADFGQGLPAISVGRLFPLTVKFCLLTRGPGGDGVICTCAFPGNGFQRLQGSRILEQVAPGACFLPSLKAKGSAHPA